MLNTNSLHYASVKSLPPFPCHNTHTFPNLITQCPVSHCLILQWPRRRHWNCNLCSSPTGEQMASYKVPIKNPPPSHIKVYSWNFIHRFVIFIEQVYHERGTRFSQLLCKSSLGILDFQLPLQRGKHSCTQIKQTTPIPHPADLDAGGENELPSK